MKDYIFATYFDYIYRQSSIRTTKALTLILGELLPAHFPIRFTVQWQFHPLFAAFQEINNQTDDILGGTFRSFSFRTNMIVIDQVEFNLYAAYTK